jgi:DUF1680 family protein
MEGSPVTIAQQTAYPFDNKVILIVDSLKETAELNLKFFIPSWFHHQAVTLNHKQVDFRVKNKFVLISVPVQAGDTIEYSFAMNSGVEQVANVSHTKSGNVRLFYGPLLLGYEGVPEISIPKNAEIIRTGDRGFQLKGTDIILSSVYHLMDAKVNQSSGYRKQILFRENQK